MPASHAPRPLASPEAPRALDAAPPPDAGRVVWSWRAADPAGTESPREARRRALPRSLLGIALAALAGASLGRRVLVVALTASLLAAAAAQWRPLAWRRAMATWSRLVARAIGAIVLSAVYLLVLWPLGAFVRRSAGARFRAAWDPAARTYWTPRTRGATSFERQF
jgi:hypothetical protein